MNKRKISAEIVADSINSKGDRITTFVLTYPRIIHAEVMTHRLFSRNAASSRAIPFNKLIEDVENDPFIPIAWQKDHKGMQGSEYFTDEKEIQAKVNCWLNARNNAIRSAKYLNSELTIHKINGEEFVSYQQVDSDSLESLMADKRIANTKVTKQLCNRLLEPFQWYTCLVTATEFDNFYELRCPQYNYLFDFYKSKKDVLKASKDGKYNDGRNLSDFTTEDWLGINSSQAEIHIQALAEAMWDAQNESTPKKLEYGMWHIPFGDRFDHSIIQELENKYQTRDRTRIALKIATARCARLSYMTFNGEIDYEKDIALHDQLLLNHHMSPFEHCAVMMDDEDYRTFVKGQAETCGCEIEKLENGYSEELYIPNKIQGWCNNIKGFIQYRYIIENEQKRICRNNK